MVVLGLGGAPSGAVAATALGTLTADPATGTDISQVSVVTHSAGIPRGCPVDATNIVATVSGPGVWAGGFIALSNTSNGISTSDDFEVRLSDTFLGIAQANSTTIVAGRYDIALTCQNRLATTQYGTFTGSVWFTDATHYQSTDPGVPTTTATTTVVTASPVSPAAAATPLTFTATVTPAAAGNIQFRDTFAGSTTALGDPQLVNGGTAATTTSSLAAGSHSIDAVFTPMDPTTVAGSTSTALPFTVSGNSPPTDLGALTFDPATGTDISQVFMNTHSTGTPKGCPAAATNIVATITGPGDWAAGFIALSNTSNGISNSNDFAVRLSDTLIGIAQANSTTIVAGRYDIALTCQNRLATTEYGTFTGPIWFTDATHYQSTDPATSAIATELVVSADPADVAAVGDSVTIIAAVTPPSAVGRVQFSDSVSGASVNLGSPVTVSGGAASLTTASLDFGMHGLSASFVPTDPARFLPSASDLLIYVISLPPPPQITRPAVLSGTARVGATVTCVASSTGATTTSYVWYRSGAMIDGASTSSRKLNAADYGQRVACRLLASNTGGTVVSTSAARVIALGAALQVTKHPHVKGTLRVGHVVKVTHGHWSPGALAYHFQWRRDGKSIRGEKHATYRVRAKDRGHKLSVVVTAIRSAYTHGTAVAKVHRP